MAMWCINQVALHSHFDTWSDTPKLSSFVGSWPLLSSACPVITHTYPIPSDKIMPIKTLITGQWPTENVCGHLEVVWTLGVYSIQRWIFSLCFFFQIKLLGMEHNFDMVRWIAGVNAIFYRLEVPEQVLGGILWKINLHTHISHTLSHLLTPPPSPQDAECLSFPDLHDGGSPSLYCSGGQCHPNAHREATGHTVHGRGRTGSLGTRTTLQTPREGHTPSCESVQGIITARVYSFCVYTQGGLGSCLLYLDFFSIAPQVIWE